MVSADAAVGTNHEIRVISLNPDFSEYTTESHYNTILHEVRHAIGIGRSDVHYVVISGPP